MSLHLQHPTKMTFIGTNQHVTINGAGTANDLYVLSGAEGVGAPWATAVLEVTNGKAFHGEVSLGSFSALILDGVQASSYSYDASHDLLKLYQGNRVVDTVHLDFDSASVPGPWNTLRVQNAPGGVYITDAYHGLSYQLGPHVTPGHVA